MNVDYQLLPHFIASRKRLEAARDVLPLHWRTDQRPEAQTINDHWVAVIAKAAEEKARLSEAGIAASSVMVSIDDR
jgi:hypothetical protein